MNETEDTLRDIRGAFVEAEHFNSKATEWGSTSTNFRGRLALSMAARLGLMEGNVSEPLHSEDQDAGVIQTTAEGPVDGSFPSSRKKSFQKK